MQNAIDNLASLKWLELIPDILFAYMQGAMMVMGATVFALAILIFFAERASGASQRIVKARIIGVRTGSTKTSDTPSTIYYPVFEYVDNDGQRVQAESFSGSSLLKDKIPNSYVFVKIDSDTPGWASPVGNVWSIIAFIMALVGVALIAGPLSFANYNVVTYTVWGLVALQAIRKGRKLFIPAKLREAKKKFMEGKMMVHDETRQTLPMMDFVSVSALIQKQDKVALAMLPVALLIFCGMIGSGYYLNDKEQKFIAAANQTTGTYDLSDDNFRKIEYIDQNGEKHHKYDDYSRLYPSTFHTGKTDIFYQPDKPGTIVIGRGIWQGLYYKLLMGFGALLLFSSLKDAARRRRRLSRI